MNGDQALIRQFQREVGKPLRIVSSPIGEAMGGYLTNVGKTPPLVELTFEPGKTFTQAVHLVQGGAIATMLDLAMAFVALSELDDGHSVATANLNVSYLRGAKIGKLVATAEIERLGRSLIFTKAALADASGNTVATATSTLSALAPR